MIEAASLAPSAKNRQPWKYIVYMESAKEELLEVMEKALINEQNEHALLPDFVSELPDAFHTLQVMKNAPAVIIVMNPIGNSLFEPIFLYSRIAEVSDTLSIGASIENMLSLWATRTRIRSQDRGKSCGRYLNTDRIKNAPKCRLRGIFLFSKHNRIHSFNKIDRLASWNQCNGFAVDGGKTCAAIIPVELDGCLRKSVIVQVESNV